MATSSSSSWTNVLSIVNHPRNRRVRYRGAPSRCFWVDDKHPMRGVHSVIDTLYLPFAKSQLPRRLPRDVRAGNARNRHCVGNSPLDHGVNVDRDMDVYVELCVRAGCRIADADWHRAVLQKHNRCCDPCSRRLVAFLRRRHWLPLRTQQVIFDHKLRLATAIDLLCIDTRTHDAVVIELKTTFHASHEYYERDSADGAHLCHVQPPTAYSYVNADLLQLYLTMVMLRRNYCRDGATVRGYLVRVPSQGSIATYDVSSDWFAAVDANLVPLLSTGNVIATAKRRRRASTNQRGGKRRRATSDAV